MPRQPGGITKFERIQAVKAVLGRWGRLGKSQIDQYVAAALNCPAEELERALYRDLEELERIGEVLAIHYTRDGAEIEDYDPEVHRNTVCRWSIPGQEHSIIGAQKLKEGQMSFLVSSRLRDAYQVRGPKESPSPDRISIYFQVESRGHCLTLQKDALPAQIILGRLNEELKDSDLMGIAREQMGKRSSYLLVPVGNVSKAKDASQPGHLCIEFREPGKIVLKDLNSKNGTFYVPLDARRANGLILEFGYLGEATLTDSASRFREEMKPTLMPSGAQLELNLPILIQASHAFELIIA